MSHLHPYSKRKIHTLGIASLILTVACIFNPFCRKEPKSEKIATEQRNVLTKERKISFIEAVETIRQRRKLFRALQDSSFVYLPGFQSVSLATIDLLKNTYNINNIRCDNLSAIVPVQNLISKADLLEQVRYLLSRKEFEKVAEILIYLNSLEETMGQVAVQHSLVISNGEKIDGSLEYCFNRVAEIRDVSNEIKGRLLDQESISEGDLKRLFPQNAGSLRANMISEFIYREIDSESSYLDDSQDD